MDFELHIRNIGKLTDANIRIGQFTVFAGPNNTGKSTVSKLLYSLFDAMNTNTAEVYIQNLLRPVIANLNRSMSRELPIKDDVKKIFSDHFDQLGKLSEKLSNTSAEEVINSVIEYKIRENLINNFQVPSLADLRRREDALSEVNIEGLGEFTFENGNIKLDIDLGGFWKLQQCPNVIYLESPIYWKLKNALENFRISPRYRPRRRKSLSGVPGYFYDLSVALRQKYTGDIAFPDLYKKLTSKDILGGKITISESEDLLFQENGRNFPLSLTAMGVANLGILALLIERKVLDEDTFLFIDEPEAHLHPAWQVIMAETLFELAKGGVNVVIATHSADILKWLEVHVKKNPEYKSMIALNKFPADSSGPKEQDFEDKIASIKQELTKPFADLYTAGL